MIWESCPWKEQLVLDAEIIQRWASKTRVTRRRSALIERKVFLAAYAIRKLFESLKLSTAFRERSLPCVTYSARSGSVTPLNGQRILERYDLDHPKKEAVPACRLMDIIVHSLAFSEMLGEDLSIEGFLVTSNRRCSRLWEVRARHFVDLMRDVGQDYPLDWRWACNQETGDFVLWQGKGSPAKSFEDRAHRIVNGCLQARWKHELQAIREQPSTLKSGDGPRK